MTYDSPDTPERRPEAEAPLAAEPETPDEAEDLFADEDLPAADELEAEDLPPTWPPLEAEGEEPPRSRRGSFVPAIVIIVLSLGLVACALWGAKLHRDMVTTMTSFDQSLAMVAGVAPRELGEKLNGIRSDLQAGHVASVAVAVDDLQTQIQKAMSGGQGGMSQGPIPEAAYKELPADAAAFFKSHEDLFRKFIFLCDRSRALKDAGKNVDDLRAARDATIEAARLGQMESVQKHMLHMAEILATKQGGPGGPGGRGQLQAKVRAFQQAAQAAVRSGRDPRPALQVARQAEMAAQGGDFAKAAKLLDQAVRLAQHAPKAPRDARMRRWAGPGRGMGGPRVNPLGEMMRAMMQVMGLEERDLAVVWDQLTKLQKGLQAPVTDLKPETLTPLVGRSLGQLKVVADRRQDLAAKLKLGRRPGAKGPGTKLGQQMTEGREERRREMAYILRQRLLPVLDRVRDMTPEQYLTGQAGVFKELVEAVMTPPTEQEMAKAAAAAAPAELNQAQAQRIRAKLEQAQPAVQKLELEGKDSAAVTELLNQARRQLILGQLPEAEKAADQALDLLGLPRDPGAVAPTTPETPAAVTPGTDDDPTVPRLRLNGRNGRRPARQPQPAPTPAPAPGN